MSSAVAGRHPVNVGFQSPIGNNDAELLIGAVRGQAYQHSIADSLKGADVFCNALINGYFKGRFARHQEKRTSGV